MKKLKFQKSKGERGTLQRLGLWFDISIIRESQIVNTVNTILDTAEIDIIEQVADTRALPDVDSIVKRLLKEIATTGTTEMERAYAFTYYGSRSMEWSKMMQDKIRTILSGCATADYLVNLTEINKHYK